MKKATITLIALTILTCAVGSPSFAQLPVPIPSSDLVVLTPYYRSQTVGFDLNVGSFKYFTVMTTGDMDYLSFRSLSVQPNTAKALTVYYQAIDPIVHEVTGSGMGIINLERGTQFRIPLRSYYGLVNIAVGVVPGDRSTRIYRCTGLFGLP
jgi:hypothetical protein